MDSFKTQRGYHKEGIMQEVRIEISIQYRSDGSVDKGLLLRAIQDVLLEEDRAIFFQYWGGGATYAGYTVSLPPKRP